MHPLAQGVHVLHVLLFRERRKAVGFTRCHILWGVAHGVYSVLQEGASAVKQYYDRVIKGRKEIRREAYVEMLGEDHVETYMYCSVCI